MKNGLLIYRTNPICNIFNIGDYIQSLAASQFYDTIDDFINREKLDEYDRDDIKLIMNGWFMHCPEHWPPSEKIKPLFVAFHLNSLAKKELLSDESINYLKLYEPIGCRDFTTVKLLADKGIKAYFSACLTLTLGLKYSNNDKNDNIFFVDPYYYINKKKILSYFLTLLSRYSDIKKISLIKYKNKSIKNLIHTVAFYQQYIKVFDKNIILNAKYINHEIPDLFKSEEDKFDYAKLLLNEYSKAHLVVTSRIHCALPCLALETPVLYIDNIHQSEVSYCRLKGIRELFNTVKNDNGKMTIEGQIAKINFNSKIQNKSDYLKYKDKLIDTCFKFSRS